MTQHLFSHLDSVDPSKFLDLDDATASDVLGGQAATASFLRDIGSPEDVLDDDQARAVRSAFAAVTDVTIADVDKKKSLLALKVPDEVRHLAGMLTKYDWDYVEQAKQIRGFIVAQLLEESQNPDARIRLRALKLLGDVTEVGAFTTRVEVTKTDANLDELQERLRAKLAALLPRTVEVQTVEVKNETQENPGKEDA